MRISGATAFSSSAQFVRLLAALLAAAALPRAVQADSEIVAVYSKTWNGYQRTRVDDKSFKPESYAFAEGGRWDGFIGNKSIDDLPFLKIAHTIAVPLKEQNYVTSLDPKTTDLVIYVFWGTTNGSTDGHYTNTYNSLQSAFGTLNRLTGSVPHQSMEAPPAFGTPQAGLAAAASSELEMAAMMTILENEQRDRNNVKNAGILGFQGELMKAWDLPWLAHSQGLVEDLEASRYFVVLKAYDFRTLVREKKMKLLWETRFSIRERGNRFDEQLAGMTRYAAQFFGQDSGHLIRRSIREGKVEVGTPTVVEPAK